MPLWLAAYLIVGAILGTLYATAVFYMADSCTDKFRVATFAVGGGVLFGLIWPIAAGLLILGLAGVLG
jgi:hypothetical protein